MLRDSVNEHWSWGLLKDMERVRNALLLIGVPLATIHAFFVKDAPGFLFPEFARIFFWHFPCPMMATGLLIAGLVFCLRYMSTEKQEWDVRATACHELAMIFIALTMISGIFFSKIQWGAWWQNDPRQVSFLLVLTIYTAYFVLRSAISDPAKKAMNSGGFAVAAFLPFMFLTFVYPRLPQVVNNHPNESIMGGNIKGGYAYVIIELLFLVTIITHWLYKIRSRAGLLELKINDYGDLQTLIGAAPHSPVARPISVSDES